MDSLDVTGLALFLVIVGVFLIGFVVQFVRQDPGATRLVVLGVRTSLFLPLYALFIFISLCAPNALAALNIPITFVEGYSFYCFYAMIVTNLGGPNKAVAAFKQSGKELICCNSCCPSDHVVFYKRTVWALFHFLFTRTVFMILSAIAFYSGTKAGKALYAIFSLVQTVILVYALIHIILFYENVYTSCRNLFGILKAILLKVSVGLIVLEGLIVQFMTVTGKEPYNDDSTWSAEDQTLRGYCILILIEFIILLIPYFFAYGLFKITPREGQTSDSSSTPQALGFCAFLCEVLKFWDVIGYLAYTDEETKAINP